MLISEERLDEGTLAVRVQGEVDVYTAPELQARVTEQVGAYKLIVVDLSGVEYIDSAGIGVLSGCEGHVREMGGAMRIVTANDRVLRAFRIAGVPDMRIVFPTVEAALETGRARLAEIEGRREPLRGELQLTLMRRPEYVSTVRLLVGSIGARLNLSYEEVEDIKLAVSEACTNAIVHGARGGENDQMTVLVSFDEEALTVEICDPNTYVDWAAVKARVEKGERSGPGGLGLLVMTSLMDEVTFDSAPERGNCVRLVKRLKKAV